MRDDMRGKVGMRMKTGSKWLTGAPLAASHDRGLGWGGHTPTVCCPEGPRGSSQWRVRNSPLPPPLPVSVSPSRNLTVACPSSLGPTPQAQDPSSWVYAVPGVRPESRGGIYQAPLPLAWWFQLLLCWLWGLFLVSHGVPPGGFSGQC